MIPVTVSGAGRLSEPTADSTGGFGGCSDQSARTFPIVMRLLDVVLEYLGY